MTVNDASTSGLVSSYAHRYTVSRLIAETDAGRQHRYVCFWHEGEGFANRVFSQWYAGKPFTVNGRRYVTAEQYMMSEKALLFRDLYTYALIMAEPGPEACKKLGRQVQGFDADQWNGALREIIFHGNVGKFTSSPALRRALTDTGDAVLVEASPYDAIYGAGLREGELLNPDGTLKVPPRCWRDPKTGAQATNHLGFVLMGVRDLLRDMGEAGGG